MKTVKTLFILLFSLMIVQPAHAEIFQYFDEEGTRIVTDDPFGTKKRDRPQYHKKQNRSNNVTLDFREGVAYEFYEVSGNTIHDAISATDRVGPFDARDGRHYAGQTQWNFGLSYSMDFRYSLESDVINASVQIGNIDFRSDITVILPSLAENSRFESAEFKAWEEFLRQLAEHENDHVRIIREPRFRQEVISGVSGIRELSLPYQADENIEAMVKGAVESRVGAVAHTIMREIKQKNDEYDNLTDHGRKPELRNSFFQRL
jgi:predicted secreted Zn-dependent protease